MPGVQSKTVPVTGVSAPIDGNYIAKYDTITDNKAAQNTTMKYTESNEMTKEEMRKELIRRGEEHFVEKSSDDGSQCTSEDLDESLSDDEVIC